MSSTDNKKSSMDFESFIMSLGANALVSLGLGQLPGQNVPKDPALAKEFIDVLIMLKEKTAGNLTVEESKTLSELISQLQYQYVTVTSA